MRGSNILPKKRKQKFKGERISIISEGVRLPLSKNKIKKITGEILSFLKEENSSVDLVFVNDKAMRKLNWRYRRVNRTTDCLAFPMRKGIDRLLNPELLGDVVICVDTAKRNAKLYGTDVKKELTLYLIHGILHLLGFGDLTREGRKRMERKQEDILRRL